QLGRLIGRARLSISQAGYNTVLDVLCAGPRMIFLPFAVHEETEQTDRAAALAARGLATVLAESASPETLASAVAQALAGPLPVPPAIDRDGASHSARILKADAR
ncbi:MAG: glycosyltransferase, partial [Pseudomonadota bacterium]